MRCRKSSTLSNIVLYLIPVHAVQFLAKSAFFYNFFKQGFITELYVF